MDSLLESALSSHGSPAKGGLKSKCLARVKIARTSAGPACLTISDPVPLPAFLTISDPVPLPAFMLDRHVPDGRVLDLLRQYVRRTIDDGGLYEDMERGISLGCPLPPLMGAFYLKRLDERMEQTGLAYARFMDDWVILAPTRWKLRAAIRLVNETLAELKLQQHPDKTFIGRVSRGFDFLGYLLTPAGLEVAPRAVERCVERVSRLYERGAGLVRIGAYVRCWQRWAMSGLREMGRSVSERAWDCVSRLLGRGVLPPGPYLRCCRRLRFQR